MRRRGYIPVYLYINGKELVLCDRIKYNLKRMTILSGLTEMNL